jgi:hypothetical protein
MKLMQLVLCRACMVFDYVCKFLSLCTYERLMHQRTDFLATMLCAYAVVVYTIHML